MAGRLTTAAALLATLPFLSPLAASARDLTPAPQVGAAAISPVAAPYAPAEDGPTAVKAAFARAKASGKSVLIDFGGNWCPDCRMLAGVFAIPEVNTWLGQNFETVSVNVNRFNANMDIAQGYGVTIKSVPTVLIVTPDGKLLDPDGATALGNARRMSAQAVVDLIAQWAART